MKNSENTITKKSTSAAWDKSIKVEENPHYHHGNPIWKKGASLPPDQPVVVELFCGCGGTSLGFEMAGFHIALGCDIHRPSVATFQLNHSQSSSVLGDIRKVDARKVLSLFENVSVDVLLGGVPCQGFSLNNRKRHQGDERNFLYKEFVRFVKVLQPKAIVLENVVGMKSAGDFVEAIEKDLSAAGKMEVKSQVLYAPDYGVPQKRERLFFVGTKKGKFDFSKIKKTHGEAARKQYVTVREAIGDLPQLGADESKADYEQPAFSEYQKWARGKNNNVLTNHQSPNHPRSTVEKIKNTSPGKPMYPRFKQRIRLAWDALSPTQVSGGIRPQFQLGHPADHRGLTIRERCRLQSFPDHFEIKGGMVQARVQTGNAVPPLLAKAIGLALKEHL